MLRFILNIKESGFSEYRRGISLKPKKSWGNKVQFTSINIKKN